MESARSERMAGLRSELARGAVVGLWAGVPQVLIVQVEEKLLGLEDDKADIGPRFVQRAAAHMGESVPPATKWALAAAFHFLYSAGWGALYALVQRERPTSPLVGGTALGALIYTLAFSHIGAATHSRTEPPPGRRRWRETLLHWTAALSFALTTAYTERWLRRADDRAADWLPSPSGSGGRTGSTPGDALGGSAESGLKGW
jgi:hypothetical protein